MKKYIKYVVLISIVVFAIIFSCEKKDKNAPKSDTILEGNTSILVDETLLPIVEDQALVFQNQYNAKLELLPKSEREAVLDFSEDKAGIIVLSRQLNKKEIAVFNQKKIKPRTTPFAIDAVTFIKNKKSNDSLIALKDVLDFLKGTKNNIKGLVFDNPNSSTASYLCKLAGIETLPTDGVFSYKTNEEVIKYVSQNDGMIGVVGINWISQPKPNMKQYIEKVNVLSVKGDDNDYVYPTQENIGTRKYPLARVLYIINCQGYEGLGMGFASFIAGEIGQRIILQSGLSPIREPSRNIRTRNQIEKK
ncbi:PstS family phosphate ABC transporter substrate-binding protein [Flavobacterium sp.]|uniref:PstS family phosphate ABC transporter substrate-binding protein n=1 Tax=Flavobacterium sp. TaxID=239 RepID=UPI0026154B99|nr:substrate-binding domain-containing protein [Flavobacterium sp.]